MRKTVAMLAMTALAGCTTINTSIPLSATQPPEGLSYGLPTRPMMVDLVYEADRGFGLSVALLPSVVDSKAEKYQLTYQGSAFDSDTVQWTSVDGLLTNVSTNSVSKLLDTAQAAGESLGSLAAALETATNSPRQNIVQVNFDPSDAASAQKAASLLTTAMRSFARTELARQKLLPPPKKGDAAAAAAKQIRQAVLTRATTATVAIDPDFGPGSPAAAPDCSIGICYRPLRFGQISISVGGAATAGVPVTQLGMTVPNGAPPIAFRVRRSGAANSSTMLTLDRGSLSSVNITKEAEAPNIARIPGAIIGGVIKGFTDTITARKGKISAQTDYTKALADQADAEAKLITAQQALKQARKGNGTIEAMLDGKAPVVIWLTDGLSTPPTAVTSTLAPVPDTDVQTTKPTTTNTGGSSGKPGGASNPNVGQGSGTGDGPPETGANTTTGN